MASAANIADPQSVIFTKYFTVPDAYFEEVTVARYDTLPAELEPLQLAKQGAWNRLSVEKDKLSI